MSDETEGKRPAPANMTMQVDALTDVQLVENDDAPGDAPGPEVSLPPPLPKRKPAMNIAVLVGVIVLMGVLGAAGAHFLVPPAEAPVAATPPPPVAAPPSMAAPPPAAEPEPEVHHVRLDEMVIGGDEPDAGPPE